MTVPRLKGEQPSGTGRLVGVPARELREFRCPCNQLFFKEQMVAGRIEIVCRHCKRTVVLER